MGGLLGVVEAVAAPEVHDAVVVDVAGTHLHFVALGGLVDDVVAGHIVGVAAIDELEGGFEV